MRDPHSNSRPAPTHGGILQTPAFDGRYRMDRVDWIIEGKLAITNHRGAQDGSALMERGIRAILSLEQGVGLARPADFGIIEISKFPLVDGRNAFPLFERAVGELDRLLKNHGTVLVQCHAGRSRSAAVAAAHLIGAYEMTPAQAFNAVATQRDVAIAPELQDLVRRYETRFRG